MNIGRERDVSTALEQCFHGAALDDLEQRGAVSLAAEERYPSSTDHIEHVSRPKLLSGLCPRHEVTFITLMKKEYLELRAFGARSKQACRDDARAVHDQHVTVAQELWKVRKGGMAVGRVLAARNHHQATRGALGRGLLRDQFRGKLEGK